MAEDREMGGALAGSLIATALLDILLAKGVLTPADARDVVKNARKAIGGGALDAEQKAAAAVLDWLLKSRFPENRMGE